ncbi:putative gustatory receptor clone PTE03 [Astyanax mexicanus]|uniref:putative gustatory receptor clone PTE03 n=1 Tax=Astyanax mexicanus TaxID=7994 RepID=UPI0020CB6348|nr:putative gustatory receptor clone PTE03 [Astyanax mexicanus]
MNDSTAVTYILLEGHIELEKYRYVYFIISFTVYLLIVCFNAGVIFIVLTDKKLHEPMYIFITALLLNSLFGTTVIYPKLLSDLLSERPGISYEGCLIQAFCIYTVALTEFTLLSAMAYDRYVSICKPLQYPTLMNMSTVRKLLFICWFVPFCEIGILVILTYRLKLCRFKLERIYCSNYAIVKLSCGDTTVNNLYGIFITVIAVIPPVIFIIFSYVRILSVCLKNSKEFRRKALQTCFPHLIALIIIFSVISCFEVINNRLEKSVPHIASMMMSMAILVILPLFNPVIYGLKLQEIKKRIKTLFLGKKRISFRL